MIRPDLFHLVRLMMGGGLRLQRKIDAVWEVLEICQNRGGQLGAPMFGPYLSLCPLIPRTRIHCEEVGYRWILIVIIGHEEGF
jgi:hypothetical protein